MGDAADKVRGYARPVFDKLDELTKDDPQTFSDLQKQERAALHKEDFEAVQKARDAQEAVLTRFADQFHPSDLKTARSLWRQGSALDEVNEAFHGKGITQPTPVKFRPSNAPDPGYINGKNFAKQVQTFAYDGTFTKAGLSPTHIQALQDLGTLLEKSGGVQQADLIAKAAKALKVAAGSGTAFPGWAASAVLGKILTDPNAAATTLRMLQIASLVSSATGITHRYNDETGQLERITDQQANPEAKPAGSL